MRRPAHATGRYQTMRRRVNVAHAPATTSGIQTNDHDSASAPRTNTSTNRYGNETYSSAHASATRRSALTTSRHQYIAQPDKTTDNNSARFTPQTMSPKRNASATATTYANGG